MNQGGTAYLSRHASHARNCGFSSHSTTLEPREVPARARAPACPDRRTHA